MLTGETRSVGKVEEEPYLHSGSGKRESVSSRGCPGLAGRASLPGQEEIG